MLRPNLRRGSVFEDTLEGEDAPRTFIYLKKLPKEQIGLINPPDQVVKNARLCVVIDGFMKGKVARGEADFNLDSAENLCGLPDTFKYLTDEELVNVFSNPTRSDNAYPHDGYAGAGGVWFKMQNFRMWAVASDAKPPVGCSKSVLTTKALDHITTFATELDCIESLSVHFTTSIPAPAQTAGEGFNLNASFMSAPDAENGEYMKRADAMELLKSELEKQEAKRKDEYEERLKEIKRREFATHQMAIAKEWYQMPPTFPPQESLKGEKNAAKKRRALNAYMKEVKEWY